MKIFISGGTGFVGSRVLNYLLKCSHSFDILAVSRNCPNQNKRGITWVNLDLMNFAEVEDLIVKYKPDLCLHLAWFAEPGEYLTSNENLDMLHASLNLIRIAGASGCQRFVAAGTCAEYSFKSKPLSEDDSANPSSLYGAAKLALFNLGKIISAKYGMEFVWGRIFYLYGPGEDLRRVIPTVVNSLLISKCVSATEGLQIRDFMHVDDVANAFFHLCVCRKTGVFNVSSGKPISMNSLLKNVGEILGKTELINFGERRPNEFDPPYVVGLNHRLVSLGWKPMFSLDEGLRDTIKWISNNNGMNSN